MIESYFLNISYMLIHSIFIGTLHGKYYYYPYLINEEPKAQEAYITHVTQPEMYDLKPSRQSDSRLHRLNQYISLSLRNKA